MQYYLDSYARLWMYPLMTISSYTLKASTFRDEMHSLVFIFQLLFVAGMLVALVTT